MQREVEADGVPIVDFSVTQRVSVGEVTRCGKYKKVLNRLNPTHCSWFPRNGKDLISLFSLFLLYPMFLAPRQESAIQPVQLDTHFLEPGYVGVSPSTAHQQLSDIGQVVIICMFPHLQMRTIVLPTSKVFEELQEYFQKQSFENIYAWPIGSTLQMLFAISLG